SSMFDRTQHQNILDEWVHPRVEGLSVAWLPSTSDSPRGFVVIKVPPQPDKTKPFVVVRTLFESGRRRDTIVSFVERRMDRNQPATAREIAQWLQDGRHFQSSTQARLDEIQAQLERLTFGVGHTPESSAHEISSEELAERIRRALTATGLETRPNFLLSAHP